MHNIINNNNNLNDANNPCGLLLKILVCKGVCIGPVSAHFTVQN